VPAQYRYHRYHDDYRVTRVYGYRPLSVYNYRDDEIDMRDGNSFGMPTIVSAWPPAKLP
jgi:hypothetical protein